MRESVWENENWEHKRKNEAIDCAGHKKSKQKSVKGQIPMALTLKYLLHLLCYR